MTDEQAVREWLRRCNNALVTLEMSAAARQALALLDAKDAELREYKEALAFTVSERDTALSRAKQAKTNSAEWASKAGCYDRERREAEAALAEERKAHQAFREEVSREVVDYCGYAPVDGPSHPITRFILPAKPADPHWVALAERAEELAAATESETSRNFMLEFAEKARAKAIEHAGGTISFEGEV